MWVGDRKVLLGEHVDVFSQKLSDKRKGKQVAGAIAMIVPRCSMFDV